MPAARPLHATVGMRAIGWPLRLDHRYFAFLYEAMPFAGIYGADNGHPPPPPGSSTALWRTHR